MTSAFICRAVMDTPGARFEELAAHAVSRSLPAVGPPVVETLAR